MLKLSQHQTLPWRRLPQRFPTWQKTTNNIDIQSFFETQTGSKLKRTGKALTGKCPFHEDKKPSFAIYTETKSAYCFACGWSGDFNWLVKSLKEL